MPTQAGSLLGAILADLRADDALALLIPSNGSDVVRVYTNFAPMKPVYPYVILGQNVGRTMTNFNPLPFEWDKLVLVTVQTVGNSSTQIALVCQAIARLMNPSDDRARWLWDTGGEVTTYPMGGPEIASDQSDPNAAKTVMRSEAFQVMIQGEP